MIRVLVRLTKVLGIYKLLKNLILKINSKFGLGHGHNLFLYIIKKKNKDFKNFLEIGSTREEIYGQGSTKIIAEYCENRMINFISVDANIKNVNRLKISLGHLKYFKIICDKGENFLKKTTDKYDCVYLDAFDIEKKTDTFNRNKFYKEIYHTNITNENSENIHLEIVISLKEKINERAIIVFDDTFIYKDKFYGKGGKAIPYLKNIGFEVIAQNSNSVALER